MRNITNLSTTAQIQTQQKLMMSYFRFGDKNLSNMRKLMQLWLIMNIEMKRDL